ncbi:MAG: transcriptional regulator, LysR family [Verrucomicrobia bacterium]|nr:transcriptional regulator, LysR family [Verrucomicrobiota bacterium]
MEIRHLRSFLAVAEHLHFGRAAQEIHLSQPALSVQIRALEDAIRTPLFVRNRRRTLLTPAGELLREDARDILARVEVAGLRAQRADRGHVGIIRIGIISTAAALLLPPVLLRFRQLYPEVVFDLENILTAKQITHLQERRLDIGFVRMPIVADGIDLTLIHEEPFILIVPASHPLAKKAHLRLKDLEGADMVLYTRNKAPSFRDQIVGMLDRAHIKPNIIQEAGEMYTLVSLVAAGLGISILPKSVELYRIPGVVIRALPSRLPHAQIALAAHRDNSSPFVRTFIELAKSIHGRVNRRG